MVEYIERGKAIAEIDKGDLLVGDNAKWAKEILCRTPTADVVPVVMCKDCKYWKKYENTAGAGCCKKREFSFEYGNEHTFNPITMPDFYCSYGERRCE